VAKLMVACVALAATCAISWYVSTTVHASGTLSRGRTMTVSASEGGRVQSVLVHEGQAVTAGQVLLRVDAHQAGATADGANARLRAAQADVARAMADLQQATSRRDGHRQLVHRHEALSARGLTTAETLDRQQHLLQVAELEAVLLGHRVDEMRAQARRVEADALDARRRLVRATVVAPISGLVTTVLAAPGQFVHEGGTNVPPSPLLTIATPRIDIVDAVMGGQDAERVWVGAAAVVHVGEHSDDWLPGQVVSVRENAPGSALVRVQLGQALPTAREGLAATVSITLASTTNVLAVPNHAVLNAAPSPQTPPGRRARSAGAPVKHGAWTVRDGIVSMLPLTLGLRGDFYTEALAGLPPGTVVVTGPHAAFLTLGVGDRVRPVPAPIHAP
jgi:multidrug resistance efflux pump